MFNVLDYGAKGDGITMNTEYIQAALDDAARTRGTVIIPEGVFLTGTLNLNGVHLHLAHGSVLKASGDLMDYPDQNWVHNEMGVLRALLVDLYHDDVTIDGSGTIDFSGREFYDLDSYQIPESRVPFNEEQIKEATHTYAARPAQCLFFHGAKHITVSGIKIVDAPCWTVTFSECEDVKCLGLTIDTNLNIPNDDGIHVSACKGVIISDCHITSGDDCIALSCITNWEKPCEDIVITNCVLKSCSKAVVIGYQYSVVRNVLVSNTIIKESNRGLCFMAHNEAGMVENVRVSNMIIDTRIRAGNWWGNGEPIMMMVNTQDSHLPPEQKSRRVAPFAIRNVVIDGATCVGENAMGIYAEGNIIDEIELRNIDYTRKSSNNICLKGYILDLSPGVYRPEVPENCGLYIENADGVSLENLRMRNWAIIRK